METHVSTEENPPTTNDEMWTMALTQSMVTNNSTSDHQLITSNNVQNEEYWEKVQLGYFIVVTATITFGFTGNNLILVTLGNKSFRKMSTSIYLAALAVADNVCLISGVVTYDILTFHKTFSFDLRSYNVAGCLSCVYLLDWSVQTSSWMIVAITVERLVVIIKPHRYKICLGCFGSENLTVLCFYIFEVHWFSARYNCSDSTYVASLFRARDLMTRKRAWIVVCSLFAFFALYKSYILFMFELQTSPIDGSKICTMPTKYSLWDSKIFPVLNIVLYAILPSCIVIASNIIIVYKLYGRKKISQESTGDQNSVYKILPMLLVVSTVFVVCTLPLGIQYIGECSKVLLCSWFAF